MTVCGERDEAQDRPYGVEEKFVRVYSDEVVLYGGLSMWFAMERELRKGCHMVPFLFMVGIAEAFIGKSSVRSLIGRVLVWGTYVWC